MIELLESDLGIAILTMISGLIGAIIAISGNVLVEHFKHKKQIEDELRAEELKAYAYMLTIITSIISSKRSIVTILNNIKVDEKGNSDIGNETKSYVFELFKKNDEMTLETLPKAVMYADDDIREMFFELYQQIQFDNELISNITKEGLEKYAEAFNIHKLEENIRNKVKILKNVKRRKNK